MFALIIKNTKLTEPLAKAVFRQLLSSISFLHASGMAVSRCNFRGEDAHCSIVQHLDIKPENVLVSNKNEIKLCDFGMAQIVAPSVLGEGKSHAKPGQLQGKRGTVMCEYLHAKSALQSTILPNTDMAPEVYAGKSFDPFKADVYSAGVSLFLMLTGGHAYEAPVASDRRFAAVIAGREGLDALLKVSFAHPNRNSC